ncbi:hypothetical protein CLOSTMETH_00854 [[Clostridium] methylpentosum DSM 5476]|uniref:Uncharacterized protein n=1 Tax=[Clostridium] methylpentosum DSM 5476 TaxID=537013 RepID=C0EAJ8_9FIRM|nr:hypothetical protein CLOSTMETH_00854 [[Clostridium] methylpentosum DSM 5476]
MPGDFFVRFCSNKSSVLPGIEKKFKSEIAWLNKNKPVFCFQLFL